MSKQELPLTVSDLVEIVITGRNQGRRERDYEQESKDVLDIKREGIPY